MRVTVLIVACASTVSLSYAQVTRQNINHTDRCDFGAPGDSHKPGQIWIFEDCGKTDPEAVAVALGEAEFLGSSIVVSSLRASM